MGRFHSPPVPVLHIPLDKVEEWFHICCDASSIGYGAVAYRRVVDINRKVHVTIITARSHVPLNPARASHHGSMPRLKLVAGVKAIQLIHFLQAALGRKNTNVLIWCNSECVLKQVFDTDTAYPAFVSLSKIHAITTPAQWRYVDSARNPTDACSRGIQAHESQKWQEFYNGLDFLW